MITFRLITGADRHPKASMSPSFGSTSVARENALDHLARWDNLPVSGFIHTLAKTAEALMKRSYDKRMRSKSGRPSDSMYSAIKKHLGIAGRFKHGTFTGATKIGITGTLARGLSKGTLFEGIDKDIEYAEVALRGRWPNPAVNIKQHIPHIVLEHMGYLDPSAPIRDDPTKFMDERQLSDYEANQLMETSPQSLTSKQIDTLMQPDMFGAVKQEFPENYIDAVMASIKKKTTWTMEDIENSPGVTVTINASGMKLRWDPSLRRKYRDITIPGVALRNKFYASEGFYENTPSLRDPLYLSGKQIKVLMRILGKALQNWMDIDEQTRAFLRRHELWKGRARTEEERRLSQESTEEYRFRDRASKEAYKRIEGKPPTYPKDPEKIPMSEIVSRSEAEKRELRWAEAWGFQQEKGGLRAEAGELFDKKSRRDMVDKMNEMASGFYDPLFEE